MASYQTYSGSWLPESAPPSNWATGNAWSPWYGTSGNDQVGGGGNGEILAGGAGDDTYWMNDGTEQVVEQPGQGVDTVILWGSYTLPANVENLTVFGNGSFAKGNSQDNIIHATGTADTLYGGLGSDVLIGNPGAGDTYLIIHGEGAKAIQGFAPGDYSNDVIRLENSPLTSFDQVKAAMTQVGADVVINNGGEGLVIRNAQINQFTAGDFQLPFNASSHGAMVFDEEFNSLQIADPTNGTPGWWTNFGGPGSTNASSYTLTRNNELQIYTSPSFTGTSGSPLGLNPFSDNNGVLTITAQPVSSAQSQQMWGYQYSSGALTTAYSHTQTYGYFEMRAQLPTGQGLWPAFWLAGGGTELDILEAVGSQPNTVYVGYHSPAGGDHTTAVYVPPTSDGYHTFGLLWTAKTLDYYVDGNEVLETATPSDMNQSMAMIANLAVGGGWAGPPNASTWPANFNIDYIRAYALGDGQGSSSPPVVTPTPTPTPPPASGSVSTNASVYAAPSGVTDITLIGAAQTVTANDQGVTFHSNDTANHLVGGAAADVFYMGRGGDVVTGGGGADTFIYNQNPWNSSEIRDFTSQDKIDFGPTLAKAGYHGSDPVGAGYMKVTTDSAGDAQIWIDPNDSYGAQGWWLGATLDGVSASSLTIQGGVITTSGASAPVQTPPPASGSVSTNASVYAAPSGVTDITLTGAAQTVTANDQGVTFHSNDTANHLVGGAAADVFYMGRGGDVVTGGGGADTFIYNQNPWNSSEIRDFTSQDKIDFGPTLAKAGYHGSDPVGAGYMKVTTDSAGDAQIWIDPNDSYGAQGWWLGATLDGVSASSLTIQGGVITTSGAGTVASSPSVTVTAASYTAPAGVTEIHLGGAAQTVTGNDLGDTFYSNNTGNTLIGGAGNDTFYLGRANDTVTGGGGADTFVFTENPYYAGQIKDFNPWQDHIDLTAVLHRAGYNGSDPIGAGFVKLDNDASGNARLWIDPNGSNGAQGWWQATTLVGVSSSLIHEHGDLFSA